MNIQNDKKFEAKMNGLVVSITEPFHQHGVKFVVWGAIAAISLFSAGNAIAMDEGSTVKHTLNSEKVSQNTFDDVGNCGACTSGCLSCMYCNRCTSCTGCTSCRCCSGYS